MNPKKEIMRVLGVISGTSMDGIDMALVKTDGLDSVVSMAGTSLPYPKKIRDKLQDFLQNPILAETDPLTELEQELTHTFISSIRHFLQRKEIDLIGLHGQTIWHCPERKFSRQLGDGKMVAKHLGIDVVDSFRQSDIQNGGHGAPFVPLYHAALALKVNERPLAVLNLGGVGNVTVIDQDLILAFDTGPASAMLDDYVRRYLNMPFDENGQIAAKGKVVDEIVKAVMQHPFFQIPPPKSLDRQNFHSMMPRIETIQNPEDAVATMAQITIESIVQSLQHIPQKPSRWLITGGGRHNLHFLNQFRERLGVSVEPVEHVGWNGDLLEAEAFAYLAVRSVKGLPLSLPTTTGVKEPMTGGIFHKA